MHLLAFINSLILPTRNHVHQKYRFSLWTTRIARSSSSPPLFFRSSAARRSIASLWNASKRMSVLSRRDVVNDGVGVEHNSVRSVSIAGRKWLLSFSFVNLAQSRAFPLLDVTTRRTAAAWNGRSQPHHLQSTSDVSSFRCAVTWHHSKAHTGVSWNFLEFLSKSAIVFDLKTNEACINIYIYTLQMCF